MFIGSLATLGLPLGLIKVISELEAENKWDIIYRILNKSFFIFLALGIIINLFLVIFSRQVSVFLFNSDEYNMHIIIVSFSLPFLVIMSFFDSILRGIKNVKLYTKISIINTLLMAVIGIIFVFFFNTIGLAINFILVAITGIIVYVGAFKIKKLISFRLLFRRESNDMSVLKDVFNIGIASLIMTVVEMITMMYLRSSIIKIYGMSSNGLYQGVYSISNSYLSMFFLIISVYSLPLISGIKDNNKINDEVNLNLRLIIIILVPIILTIFTFRDLLIVLLYSREFLSASNLFFYNLLGDFFKLLGTIFSLWLIAKSKVKALVFFNILFNAGFVFFFFLFVYTFNFGLESMPASYFMASLIFMLCQLLFFIYGNKYRISKQNIILLSTSLFMIVSLFAVTRYSNIGGYIFIVVYLLIWGIVSIKKTEFYEIIEVVKEKYRAFNYGKSEKK